LEGHAVSRSSIIGKLHRMGLSSENKTKIHSAANHRFLKEPRPKRALFKPKSFARLAAVEQPISASNVHGIDALKPHHCRFILNDAMRDPVYCGAHVSPHSRSWCPHHHEACRYVPAERRAA
jgi:hypothetical protein